MTMNLYATQEDILAYLKAEADFEVFDTNYPDGDREPTSDSGILEDYAVIRFNDGVKIPQIGAVGGARWDEMYTLIDVLCVAADPTDARSLAYGVDGVADILTGYVPVDAGQLTRQSGGQVFVRGDGTATKPTRYVAIVSFRVLVNTTILDD